VQVCNSLSKYISYTDESASPDQTGIFLISGYVGDEVNWPEFSNRWRQEILAPKPTIPYLHMVEIRSTAWRQTHKITRDEASEKVHKAVRLISEMDFMSAYFAQISEKAYSNAVKVVENAGINVDSSEIDYICFIAFSLRLMQEISRSQPAVEQIDFNISKKQRISHHLQHGLHEAMALELQVMNSKLAMMFGKVVPLDMREHTPLQAADVLCWHLQRSYSSRQPEEIEVLRNTAILQNKELAAIEVPDMALEALSKHLIDAAKSKN
jgi:hypothetical protein